MSVVIKVCKCKQVPFIMVCSVSGFVDMRVYAHSCRGVLTCMHVLVPVTSACQHLPGVQQQLDEWQCNMLQSHFTAFCLGRREQVCVWLMPPAKETSVLTWYRIITMGRRRERKTRWKGVVGWNDPREKQTSFAFKNYEFNILDLKPTTLNTEE